MLFHSSIPSVLCIVRISQRVFYLVHHNLWANAKIGFHSHNNLQMSFALSQDFIDMSQGLRDIVVDSTMAGMGRGAGNTNTELVMQYRTVSLIVVMILILF